jgi:predicted outer membrane repeat protein
MVATITDCTLENNYGAIYGGAALSYQSGSGSGSLTVNGTTFENNYSNYTGDNNSLYSKYCGAIRLGNDGTKCYFNDCTFIGNHAKTNTSDSQSTWGGAVCYYGDDMIYFNRCYFEDNYATRGGAISSFKCGGIYMNACSFKGNYISWKNGTTIMVEQTTKFCMNNCSIYDDTYTTSSGGDFCSWVYLQGGSSARKMQEYVISNCSMIARSTSPIATMSGDQESLYILNSKDGSTGALINNILVLDNDTSAKNDWWLNLAPMNGYNNIEKKRGWNGNTSYTGSNDTLGKGASDFGNLNWENNAWTWNGTLAGGYTPITADSFATYLNAASSDFKVWLTSIGALNQDQLGHNRGTGSAEWWPGAYQN